jgi:DNA-directed RNA polymerase subunit M/transcription elongation factor TFIIS
MKTSNHLSSTLLVLSFASLALLPATSSAQKKGATELIQMKPIQTVADAQAVQPGDTVVMSCPKCKDSWLTVVEKPTKQGATPETKTVMRYECPGCEHKIATEGQGKNATDKIVHTCKKCGSENAFCCVMQKSTGKPTPGMEKK